jgi:hypothetical protein
MCRGPVPEPTPSSCAKEVAELRAAIGDEEFFRLAKEGLGRLAAEAWAFARLRAKGQADFQKVVDAAQGPTASEAGAALKALARDGIAGAAAGSAAREALDWLGEHTRELAAARTLNIILAENNAALKARLKEAQAAVVRAEGSYAVVAAELLRVTGAKLPEEGDETP